MQADRFKGTKMRFVINESALWHGLGVARTPPEGVEAAVNAEHKKGVEGRWGAGLPGYGRYADAVLAIRHR